jgi:hypothetical protein
MRLLAKIFCSILCVTSLSIAASPVAPLSTTIDFARKTNISRRKKRHRFGLLTLKKGAVITGSAGPGKMLRVFENKFIKRRGGPDLPLVLPAEQDSHADVRQNQDRSVFLWNCSITFRNYICISRAQFISQKV